MEHAADARAMGKPFMIEEFGKQVHMETPVAQANLTSVRTPFYRKVYKAYTDSIAAGDDLVSGALLFPSFVLSHTVTSVAFGIGNTWLSYQALYCPSPGPLSLLAVFPAAH